MLTELEKRMFNPYRIMILHQLIKEKELRFRDLKKYFDITDGNLGSHLRVLIEIQCITISKTVRDNKFVSRYSITDKGMQQYTQLFEIMDSMRVDEL